MKPRRVLLWIAANTALTVVTTICCGVWLALAGPAQEFPSVAGNARGGLLPIGTLLVLVGATLLVANVAYVVVSVARRR